MRNFGNISRARARLPRKFVFYFTFLALDNPCLVSLFFPAVRRFLLFFSFLFVAARVAVSLLTFFARCLLLLVEGEFFPVRGSVGRSVCIFTRVAPFLRLTRVELANKAMKVSKKYP